MTVKEFFEKIEDTTFAFPGKRIELISSGGLLGYNSYGDERQWITLHLPKMTVVVSSNAAEELYSDYEIDELIEFRLDLYELKSDGGNWYTGSDSTIELSVLPPNKKNKK